MKLRGSISGLGRYSQTGPVKADRMKTKPSSKASTVGKTEKVSPQAVPVDRAEFMAWVDRQMKELGERLEGRGGSHRAQGGESAPPANHPRV